MAWLDAHPLPPDHAVVTSLPDLSELPSMRFEGWKRWFSDTAALACARTAPEAVTVFYQTDIKHEGRWIDKARLVDEGADAAGSQLLWHRIVCRVPPGTPTFGRPGYAHLLCYSRGLRLTPAQSAADVLPALGAMPWPRAMGAAACEAVCTFLLAHTGCRVVVDPFCGHGTMLAVANARGLAAVGVELSAKRADRARRLEVRAGEWSLRARGAPPHLPPAGKGTT